jgi:hypothetical protein
MANDLPTMPATVVVVFPATGSAAPASGFYKVAVTLVSLALTSYQGITGAPWQKLLHRYEQATYAGGGSPTNAATLTTRATQIATDWYGWQLAKLDQYFTGAIAWNPEGFHDLEWAQEGKITTHVQRVVRDEDLLNINSCCQSSNVETTTSAITIPLPGNTVTVAVNDTSNVSVGQQVSLSSGGTTVNATVVSITGTNNLVLQVTNTTSGTVGTTLPAGVVMVPVGPLPTITTTSPFIVPTVNGVVTVTVPSTTTYYPGQTVTITNPAGTVVMTGTVTTIPTSTTITITNTGIPLGSSGNTIPIDSGVTVGNPIQPTTTTGTFVTPIVGTPVTGVTVTSTTGILTGQLVTITDGTNIVTGTATVTSGTQITFTPTIYTGGAPGNTVATSAQVIPQTTPTILTTTGSFVIPIVGTGVTVSTSSTSSLTTNQIITISDGIHTVQGYVTPLTGTTFTFTPISIFAGVVGNTISSSAVITSSSLFLSPLTTIASGATVDLSTALGNIVNVTGNTTISSFGTVPAGVSETVTFASDPTLTNNNTSMILPGAQDLTVQPGGILQAVSLGSGNWQATNYTPPPIVMTANFQKSTIGAGSSISLTTNTAANITSLSLPAGDWDVSGAVDFAPAGAAIAEMVGGSSTTSGVVGAQDASFDMPVSGTLSKITFPLPTFRYNLGTTTTVYLVASCTFVGGTVNAYGTLRARRMN